MGIKVVVQNEEMWGDERLTVYLNRPMGRVAHHVSHRSRLLHDMGISGNSKNVIPMPGDYLRQWVGMMDEWRDGLSMSAKNGTLRPSAGAFHQVGTEDLKAWSTERERKGTGFRVEVLRKAVSPERARVRKSDPEKRAAMLMAPQGRKPEYPARVSMWVGKSDGVRVNLPQGVAAMVKPNTTTLLLMSQDLVSLGDASYKVMFRKPRNPYTGVGVVMLGKQYRKLKSTKRGSKK